MRVAFTIHDAIEISNFAYRAFFSTFDRQSVRSGSDSGSDSDSSDFNLDLDGYVCGEITPEVESLVQDGWEICHPLDEVFGPTGSDMVKQTILTATEDTQCIGLKLLNHISSGEDRNLIAFCADISYWCCCESLKKVSLIIAEATANLIL